MIRCFLQRETSKTSRCLFIDSISLLNPYRVVLKVNNVCTEPSNYVQCSRSIRLLPSRDKNEHVCLRVEIHKTPATRTVIVHPWLVTAKWPPRRPIVCGHYNYAKLTATTTACTIALAATTQYTIISF